MGSPALLLQMATNLVHNAIVHNLPEQGHRVGHDQRSPQKCGAHVLTVENTGEQLVNSITQAHDGTLTLTPRRARGLRVTVQLPPAPLHAGNESSSRDRSLPSGTADSKR
jgi:two-component system sensor histidine kinase VanS